jgi:peptidoglycan/LPS O-acetylase OafA/YrhL
VYAFFAMSGYLVTQSWMRDPCASRFMMRRGLRILPGLAFAIVTSVAIIGPLTTILPETEYFSGRAAWTYLAKVLVYPTQYGLPGVFEHNTFPLVVNGSLWSIRLECGLYLMVAAVGYWGLLRRRSTMMAIAALCVISVAMLMDPFLSRIPFHHQEMILFLNATPFLIGASLAQSNLDARAMVLATSILTLATVLLIETPAFKIMLLLTLPFAIVLIGRYGKCDLRRFGDYSYGIYLFAFPIQQSVIHFLPHVQPIDVTLIASPITFCCAAVSWHLIEKHALTLKPRRQQSVAALSRAYSAPIESGDALGMINERVSRP